jgi:hypothetical protein
MPHCQRMGEVDLGVNKDECCGKHDQKRGTDLENEHDARSRWLFSFRGHDGLLNGSSKQKRRVYLFASGAALLAATTVVTDSTHALEPHLRWR